MFSPSTIDLKSLPWLPLEEKTAFPKRPAIYFAIDSLGTVQYIGRTKNVRTRWNQHHKYEVLSAIADIKVAYLFVDLPELLPEIEQALIEYFDPPLNGLWEREKTKDYSGLGVKIMFKLKEMRSAKGLSQNEVARMCEMSVTNIRKYEQGKMRSIPFETLALFCRILDCQPGDLFEKVLIEEA